MRPKVRTILIAVGVIFLAYSLTESRVSGGDQQAENPVKKYQKKTKRSSEQPINEKLITIVGEVNDTYQIIVRSGEAYEVAGDEMGDYIVYNLISQIVKIRGIVIEGKEGKIIKVVDFEVLDE